MLTLTSRFFLATSLLVLSAAVGAADWNQVFKQTTPQTVAQPEAATPAPAPPVLQPAPAARAPASRAATSGYSRSRSARAETRAVIAQPPVERAATTAVNPAAAEVARGEQLYLRGDIAGAARVFEDRALAAGTPAEQSSTLFRVGVQWHNDIRTAKPDKKLETRNAAVSAYQKTLQLNPKSGPALNNLAQLLKSDPAKSAEADALLARAVALDDSRKGVYLMNRAELKRDSGDMQGASSFALEAAADDKGNEQAHALVMNLLVKQQDAKALLDYIRDLNQRGLVVRALDSAVDGMTSLPEARPQLLASMASTIGDAAYTANPWEFENTDAGHALGKFAADAAIGPGVTELFRVLRAPAPMDSLTWWKKGFDGFGDPDPGSPAQAMQNLTRRCGEIYYAASDPRAEGYYQMSVALSGRMATDPRALLGLTEILYEQKRLDDLNKVLKENEQGLMDAKRRTIAASDYLHTYQLRLALGMMYGYVERWKNPTQQYAASIWMLENAQESAKVYNRRAKLTPEQQVKLPPNAVKMLSTGYAKTNDLTRSVQTRLDFAELYLANGQKRFAQVVLDADWQRTLPASLDAALKQRLADVTSRASG